MFLGFWGPLEVNFGKIWVRKKRSVLQKGGQFHVNIVLGGNLRSNLANFVGTKKARFCRKEAKVGQRSPPSMEGGDL